MVLETLEIILLIFVVLGLIKFVFLLFNPKAWFDFAKKLYRSAGVLALIEFVLAAIIFYYLYQSLTIVQIMSGVVLGALLTGITFAVYAKESMVFAGKLMKDGFMKKAWLPMLIWLALFVWTLWAILA
jgi:hypothetical protein